MQSSTGKILFIFPVLSINTYWYTLHITGEQHKKEGKIV